jgi:hypothetical protein
MSIPVIVRVCAKGCCRSVKLVLKEICTNDFSLIHSIPWLRLAYRSIMFNLHSQPILLDSESGTILKLNFVVLSTFVLVCTILISLIKLI